MKNLKSFIEKKVRTVDRVRRHKAFCNECWQIRSTPMSMLKTCYTTRSHSFGAMAAEANATTN